MYLLVSIHYILIPNYIYILIGTRFKYTFSYRLIKKRLDTIKQAIIVIIILISLAIAVYSAPPSLPTSIEGIVLRADATSVIGKTVTATFIDNDEKIRQASVSTLSHEQNSAGKFFFNLGKIQAAKGSNIVIESGGSRIQVPAAPGLYVHVGSIILPIVSSGKSGTGNPGSGAGSGIGSGEGSGIGIGEGSGAGIGQGPGVGTGTGVGIGTEIGIGEGAGPGLGTGIGIGTKATKNG